MISRLLLCLVVFNSVQVFAQALTFQTLKAAHANGSYRLTCSDTAGAMHAHVQLVVSKGVLEELSLYAISPAESIWSTKYSAADLAGLKRAESDTRFTLEGERPGAYWGETLSLTVNDGGKGTGKFTARLDWDSHDGEEMHRNLNCGAVNYILAPGT